MKRNMWSLRKEPNLRDFGDYCVFPSLIFKLSFQCLYACTCHFHPLQELCGFGEFFQLDAYLDNLLEAKE